MKEDALQRRYRKYCRQKRNAGCRPLSYYEWLAWREKEHKKRMECGLA